MTGIRVAVDIGGTFTDVALEDESHRHTAKVLTTPAAPEQGVMQGLRRALSAAGRDFSEIGLVLHGTTLATNALIERKGARTALVTTQGFRDSVEIAYENRFEQYDVNIDKPAPLVPRHLRFTVPERLSAAGRVLKPLDEAAVQALVPRLEAAGVESLAVGFLHAYVDGGHERRVGELLQAALPRLSVSLSSEVSPEIREYERLSTVCANAYVRPLMAGYLDRLERELAAAGYQGAVLMMTSGGGVCGLDTAKRLPVRLVESGPAGGAILAAHIAAQRGLDQVLSFDMGGTTAKICLIDDARPQTARSFEVARIYRFLKGSGLPLRIPVIEMVEIGAGGGSLARVDELRRIAVGPESGGADPGPACYGRGGAEPAVTDADLVLGRLDEGDFAGGTMALDAAAARTALDHAVGSKLDLDPVHAALGVSEMVDENMSNAARVHAVERGKDLGRRTMIAFGGAAPVHAARVADKLGIGRIIVPTGAGVGSAVGILRAPVAYEVAHSRYMKLDDFDADDANRLLKEMRDEAAAVIAQAGATAPEETRLAYMRYGGQGHEIEVELPVRPLAAGDADLLRERFDAAYRALFGRLIPGLGVEVISWALTLATLTPPPDPPPPMPAGGVATAEMTRELFDPGQGAWNQVPVHRRDHLTPGDRVIGPALIVEDETTTVVGPGFTAAIDGDSYIVMTRSEEGGI